jgi:hypothetical protein
MVDSTETVRERVSFLTAIEEGRIIAGTGVRAQGAYIHDGLWRLHRVGRLGSWLDICDVGDDLKVEVDAG